MSEIFRTEGPLLEKESHLYVERAEDRKVANEVRGGDYVALMGARQTGKTSLLLRLRRQLLEEGHIPIYLDLSPARDREREAWYRYLHSVLQGQLERDSASVDVPTMRDHVDFREALRRISGQLSGPRKVVVLLDEVSSLPGDVSDYFFSTIRTVFNEREPFPEFQRYVFVMGGTFIPDQLVEDPLISPFNIASKIHTSDASRDELANLIRNLEKAGYAVSGEISDRIYSWTGGHPYLTQRLCAHLEAQACDPLSCQHVDAAADALRSDGHIKHIYGKLDQAPEVAEVLERIMAGDRPLNFNRASTLVAELDLLGVIKKGSDGACRIRNAIYRKALADKYDRLSSGDAKVLTRLENELFEYFCRNVNRTCTYHEIAETIWGQGAWAERSIEDRIYQLVARVRRKIEADPANTVHIMTVRGRGYKPQRRG